MVTSPQHASTEVEVWNGTVANLTLLALGSSALGATQGGLAGVGTSGFGAGSLSWVAWKPEPESDHFWWQKVRFHRYCTVQEQEFIPLEGHLDPFRLARIWAHGWGHLYASRSSVMCLFSSFPDGHTKANMYCTSPDKKEYHVGAKLHPNTYTISKWVDQATSNRSLWCHGHTISGWWFGTFSIFPYIGNNHPNWRSYFSEGFKPPTRYGHWSSAPPTCEAGDPAVCSWDHGAGAAKIYVRWCPLFCPQYSHGNGTEPKGLIETWKP